MIWNFGKGEVLKGCDAQLYLPLIPPCSPLTLDELEDFTVSFFTTVGGSAVTKNLSDFTVSGNMGTIVFQAVELEPFDDGVIRYTTHYTVTATGMEGGFEFISNYFLKTPVPYEPIDFVTTEEVQQVVNDSITASTAITQMVEQAVIEGGFATTGICEDMISTAIAAETARTEETYQKTLTPGRGIEISGNTISATEGKTQIFLYEDMPYSEVAAIHAQLLPYTGNPRQIVEKFDFWYNPTSHSDLGQGWYPVFFTSYNGNMNLYGTHTWNEYDDKLKLYSFELRFDPNGGYIFSVASRDLSNI